MRVKLDAAPRPLPTIPSGTPERRRAARGHARDHPDDQIQARLGCGLDHAEIHQQFLRELLNDRYVQVENPLPTQWKVTGNRHSVRATSEWGTTRRPATDIAESSSRSAIRVETTRSRTATRCARVLNPIETTAAQEKADAMQDRFGEWVWEDPDRAAALGRGLQPTVQPHRAPRLLQGRRTTSPCPASPTTSPRARTSAPPSPE